MGSPYVYGAAGPSAFDCSGLTSWAYRQALPKSERSLYDALKGTNRFIMECKSSSPSLGLIREHYEPGTEPCPPSCVIAGRETSPSCCMNRAVTFS